MSEVEPWLADHLPAPGTGLALDIGANIGNWSVELASRCREVHAFEPNPQCHQMLLGRLAGRGNVRVFEAAVGDDVGSLSLHLYGSHAHASAFTDSDLDTASRGEAADTVAVPLVSLDAFGYWTRPVDYMKVDVEGAEVTVLQGAVRTLAAWRPQLLIEVHNTRNRDWLQARLPDLGYQPQLLPHPHRGVHEGHCWITATRPERT